MILFFTHIPKTGGQTLKAGYRRAFGKKRCISVYNGNFPDTISVEEFERADLEARPRFWTPRKILQRVLPIIGHLKVREFLKNDFARQQFEKGNARIISVVRDPIERRVSTYNYVRYNPQHPMHEKISKMPFLDFISLGRDNPDGWKGGNMQLEFLKISDDSTVDEVLDQFEIFPIEHSTEGVKRVIRKYTGANLGPLEIANTSREHAAGKPLARVEDIPPDLLAELRARDSLDIELCTKVSQRWEQCST